MYLLSIDLESWVQRPVYKLPLNSNQKINDNEFMVIATEKILKILKKYNKKATFFVLGQIVEWYPDIIEKILIEGHEIGYHGFSHQFIHKLSKNEFEAEIEKGEKIFTKFGFSPRGFRAPSFSRTHFMEDILLKYGYLYDSSVMPVKTPLYDGSEFKDSKPFKLGNGLVEIPISVFKSSRLKIPLGGFYLRLFGKRINSLLLKKVHDSIGVAMLYLHPWELFNYKGTKLPFHKNIFAKYRVPALDMFEYLLERYPWDNIVNNWGKIELMAETSGFD